MKSRVTYDLDADALYIYNHNLDSSEFKNCEVLDNNFILDISKENEIKGLEFLFVSNKLNISKQYLSKIKNCDFQIKKNKLGTLKLILTFLFEDNLKYDFEFEIKNKTKLNLNILS